MLDPPAAASTIRARSNIRAWLVGRVSATNAACYPVDNTIRCGLHGGTGTFCQSPAGPAGSDTPPLWGRIEAVAKPPPESTKTSLRQCLTQHASTRWPALAAVNVRYRGVFAYIDGHLADGTTLPLCRLRYNAAGRRLLATRDSGALPGLILAPPGVSAPIGVDPRGQEVSLFDLPGPGLALHGDGAPAVARAILAATLATAAAEHFAARPVVMTTAQTLARLCPQGRRRWAWTRSTPPSTGSGCTCWPTPPPRSPTPNRR